MHRINARWWAKRYQEKSCPGEIVTWRNVSLDCMGRFYAWIQVFTREIGGFRRIFRFARGGWGWESESCIRWFYYVILRNFSFPGVGDRTLSYLHNKDFYALYFVCYITWLSKFDQAYEESGYYSRHEN